MTDNFIHKVTLECLTNQKNLEVFTKDFQKEVKKEDIDFYKKKILQLTKDLLLNENVDDEFLYDVKKSYEKYAKSCVLYFKEKDKQKDNNNT
jgi:hypothetical protein